MDKLALFIAGEISLSRDPGSSMRKWREVFGVSQSELAEFLGVSPSTISDYESGRRRSPGIGVVRRFVEALLEIDRRRGGVVARQLLRQFSGGGVEAPFEVHEFYTGIPGSVFVERVEGVVHANGDLLGSTVLYGYTLIDSVRTVLELGAGEFLKLFGSTPRRALVFSGVTTGRSPLIAVKVGRACSDFVPEMVVLVGIDRPDYVALRIAERERVVLVTTGLGVGEIVSRLREFE